MPIRITPRSRRLPDDRLLEWEEHFDEWRGWRSFTEGRLDGEPLTDTELARLLAGR